jgi:ParB family chromosome partitioning protein
MAAKEKKGLGAGLGALFGEENVQGEDVSTLPLAKIEPRTEQPREFFDEQAMQSLADSIARYGLIQPITVRPLPSGYYQIIAGERRWRAARLAGLTEVPVRIMEADDRTTAELALVENLQREDLNPIEEAKGYQLLIEEYGFTQEEAAKSVGRSRPAVANALRLLNLSPEVMHLVETGELSAGHARALVSVSEPGLQLQAAKEILSKALSVRKAEALAAKVLKKSKEPEKEAAEANDGVDYAKEISSELTKSLGRKVLVKDKKGNGKIELEYYGADDREFLISKLKKLKL